MFSDLRYAVRRLRKNPAFTLAAVLTLGIAIGASTSTFSVVNAVLLRSLPYPNADRLVLLWGQDLKRGETRQQICFPDLDDWMKQSHTLEDAAAYTGYWTPALAGPNGAEQLNGIRVSSGYFNVLQAHTVLGRTFEPADMWEGRGYVAVISNGLWKRRFSSDPNVIGSTIRMSGRSFTVIGVLAADVSSMPSSLIDHDAADVYMPLSKTPYTDDIRNGHHLRAIARLKPGATIQELQQELDLISTRLGQQYPESNAGRTVRAIGFQQDIVRQIKPALVIMQACVLVVLLLGCANVANLLLAQFTARRRELAIRGALGAGRAALIRQMLAECLVLATLSGLAGLAVTAWSVPLIEALGAKSFPNLAKINVDWRVAGFAAIASLFSGAIFGLAPALIAATGELNEALKSGGRGSSGGSGSRLRSLLVVGEIGGALALLVCAALLVVSFVRLRAVNPGFDGHNTLVADVGLPAATYPKAPERQQFFTRLMEDLSHAPGVVSVGGVSVLPESPDFNTQTMDVEGRSFARGEAPTPDVYGVTPGYFSTFSIPLIAGRLFTTADDTQHERVAIINQTAAQALWPAQDALGHRIRTGTNEPWRTIVGVVGDVYQYGLDSRKTMQLYFVHTQDSSWGMSVLVKGSGDSAALAPTVRASIKSLNPELPVSFQMMDDVLADSVAARRFSMTVMAAFGICAVILAAIGIYGVISYSVAQRTAEFGIRMALGAQTRHILQLVVGGGLSWIALGMLLGLGSGLALTRYLASLLFGVSPRDPVMYLAASVFLAAVAMLASYVPARRATRVDPIIALRTE